MANTSSAKKAQRAAERRHIFNTRRKKAVKDSVKEIGKSIVGKMSKEATDMLPTLYKAIDKAAKNGTIKKNTAARMKSRVTRQVAALSKGK